MKWRCPQCGKPHEKNDPPCDNCGHHKFERAVVPTASADEDHEQFVWACTECGRHHQRNNPPCSRCGNAKFEKEPLDYDEFDPGSTASYFDLVGRLEVSAALVIVALVTVGVLGFLGVINVPGLTPQGPPTVENVPGNETAVGDGSLADVETSVFGELNVDRTPRIGRAGGLDAIATYVNQRTVKSAYTDTDGRISDDQLRQFDVSCSGRLGYLPLQTREPVNDGDTADAVAREFTPTLESIRTAETGEQTYRLENVGIDAHAGPDGRVFVTVAFCQTAAS